MLISVIGLSHYSVYRQRMRNSGRALVYVAYAGDTFCISYGHATIRWHTLVYVVIRRTCPKILFISNVCRRIDYTFSCVAYKLLIR